MTYFVFDDRVVANARNLRLELGKVRKCPRNPLFAGEFFSRPPRQWEARYDNLYPSVSHDAVRGRFELWYNVFIRDAASERTPLAARPHTRYWRGHREEGLLYARSADGIQWEKPALGIVSFGGDTDNNIVMDTASHGIHGVGVLKDPRDPDPMRRFKAFLLNEPAQRMAVAFSADGLRWSPPIDSADHDAIGDAHPNALRLCDGQGFVGFMRGLKEDVPPARGLKRPNRLLRRTVSPDFLSWSPPEVVLEGRDLDDQIYSMPVAQAHGIYIGLPAIFHAGDPEGAAWDAVDTELACSPDSRAWHRLCPGTPLIPRGDGTYPTGAYDCGCIYAAAPLLVGDRYFLYYAGSNGTHTGFREGAFCLATLARDRFAGYRVVDAALPGRLTTSPLVVDGDCLLVNAETAAGALRVGIQESPMDAGRPAEDPRPRPAAMALQDNRWIAGFAPAECRTTSATDLTLALTWSGSLAELRGRRVRLVFELHGAKLYAFSLGPGSAR